MFLTCSKDKYEATIPTYISIDKITLTTDYPNEGSSSNNITDAWIFINNDLVGAFELPATVPVLKEGNVEVKVFAGIKDNGISATRTRYAMYDPYIKNITLIKGETIKLEPTVTYNKDVNFTWIEDFEGVSLSFLYTNGSDTVINKQNITVKEGDFSGQIYLKNNMDFFEATSVPFSNLPRDGSPIYLEMDFKTNEPLLVGVYHNQDAFAVITLNTTDEWKKIYINLTDMIASKQSSTDVKVFFGMLDTPSNPFKTNNPIVYIDNIKFMHF